jgi:hypothetical protein
MISIRGNKMKIKEYQVFAFMRYFPFIFLISLCVFSGYKLSGMVFCILFIMYCIYLLVQILLVLGKSKDDKLYFNTFAQNNIMNDICPLCGKNKSSTSSLDIGYKKGYWNISYRIIYVRYSVNT